MLVSNCPWDVRAFIVLPHHILVLCQTAHLHAIQ